VSVSTLQYADQGPVLKQYRQSRNFVQFIMGPLGSAKTTTSIFKLLEFITEQKPNKVGERRSRWAVIRNTYPDLTNTTIRDFRAVVDPLRLGTFTMGHPPEMKMDFDLPDKTRVMAEIIFIALDKDDDVRKLRGLNITGAWVNELKEIPKSILDMLMGRVDRYPTQGTSTWAGIFGDTNAWDSDHWLEVIAEGKRQGKFADYDILYQPGAVLKIDGEWVVNPERENLQFLNEDYYRRQLEGKREDWIKVNLGNQIGYYVDGRAVHPEYSDSLHAAPRELIPSPGVVQVGLDFGLTPAAAFLQRQDSGVWWWFDEIVIEDGDAITLADQIRAKCAEWQARLGANRDGQPPLAFVFRGDPSGDNRAQSDSSTPFKVMRANGVSAFPASSNDPVIRRAALDRVLTRTVKGKPGFQISPTCRWARKGLAGGFHYKRVAVSGQEGKFRDEPNKNLFSHICEAGEYSLMDAGENAVVNGSAAAQPKLQRPIATGSSWNPFEM
jgi:phage terminase large subunit